MKGGLEAGLLFISPCHTNWPAMSFIPFGRYEIAPVETGRLRLDGGAMFGVVPRNLWEKTNPADEQNRIDMRMRTLLIRDAERTILVDAGVGHKESDKFNSIFAIDFSDHTLEGGLRALGVAPEDVTDVIVTHLHFDHVGGAVIHRDDELRLRFPNADHYVQRRQWDWANAPSDRDRASYLPYNFVPIDDAGKLRLLDGEEELFPDLHLHVVDGHTFGQQLIRLTDGDQSVVYAADLIPMSSHVPAPWIMGYDLQPLNTLAEKEELLSRAVTKRDILVFEHDAFSEASLVGVGKKGYEPAHAGRLSDVIQAAES